MKNSGLRKQIGPGVGNSPTGGGGRNFSRTEAGL